MRKLIRTAALVSFVLVSTPAAFATGQGNSGQGPFGGQGQGGPPKAFLACREDVQTFCKGIQPGGGRIRDCLEDHYKEISEACYNVLKNVPSGPPRGGLSNGDRSNGGSPPDNGGSDNGPPAPPLDGNGDMPPPPSDNGQ